jgi:hypothetical protein
MGRLSHAKEEACLARGASTKRLPINYLLRKGVVDLRARNGGGWHYYVLRILFRCVAFMVPDSIPDWIGHCALAHGELFPWL